jgi:excisionase family DNA binding protein
VAELLQVSVATVRNLIHSGDLVTVQLGPRNTRIARSAVDDLIQRRTRPVPRVQRARRLNVGDG